MLENGNLPKKKVTAMAMALVVVIMVMVVVIMVTVVVIMVMMNLKADRKVSCHEETEKCRCEVDNGDKAKSDHGGADIIINHSVVMV